MTGQEINLIIENLAATLGVTAEKLVTIYVPWVKAKAITMCCVGSVMFLMFSLAGMIFLSKTRDNSENLFIGLLFLGIAVIGLVMLGTPLIPDLLAPEAAAISKIVGQLKAVN